MAVKTFTPVLGKRIRVTVLDECGNPPEVGTENAVLATDGFISVTLSAETEDGNEIVTRKADGSICVNERTAASFKRLNVELTFCEVNPALASMVSNAEPYMDGDGDIAGFTIPEGEMTKKFALEIWTGLSGQACEPGQEIASGYLLLPFLQAGVVGNIEINGENAVTFSVSGSYTVGGNAWGVGPFNVVKTPTGTDAPLPTALDSMDHLLMMTTALAYPPSSADPTPMPDLAAA